MRESDTTNILRAGRLIQQFQIDMYVKVETQRLDYLRHSQTQAGLRAESVQGIVDSMVSSNATHGASIGKRIILPAGFTGGHRNLLRRYMAALTLVERFGKPDFFITMTCNPRWAEIQDELFRFVEKPQNIADLYARVFKAKLEELKHEIVGRKLFGKVAAYFYVVEFQKRGMPHVHFLIIMKPKYKLFSVEAYDKFVSAEISDKNDNPHLHACVVNHMMHGPCGDDNPHNVCMVKGRCKCRYPKPFSEVTEHRADAYPAYRRPNNDRRVTIRKCNLDNRWVIPYNPYLLAKFDCHINIEICADIRSVKYLYKYVCKGNARVAYNITDGDRTEPVNEIDDYQSARWICAPEAMWRIYEFDMYDMYPAVAQLHVHLPNHQWVSFSACRPVSEILASAKATRTQLTEFFRMNSEDPVASSLNLLYRDFLTEFVWSKQRRLWTKRIIKRVCIGRLVTVNPVEGERYYLRLLLSHVKGPTSFQSLRTSNGVVFSTFREAAFDRGLLDSDSDVQGTLEEACRYQMPYMLRRLFATILVYNSPSNPAALWEQFKDELASDLLREMGNRPKAHESCLRSLHVFLQSFGRHIDEYSLVSNKLEIAFDEVHGREYDAEKNFVVSNEDLLSITKLNSEQKQAFNRVMQSVRSHLGQAFFVDGPGGTGKTFLYRALLAEVRSKGDIALAVASSGVAASLLPNGRTAHSRFKLPINIDEFMSCAISKQSMQAQLIVAARLIVWDEASMSNKKVVEALDSLLQDLTGIQSLFGGKTIVFGGDFRQTIPIVRRGSRREAVDACLVNSSLWNLIEKIHLTVNMRAKEDPLFIEYLMGIGNGTEPCTCADFIRLPERMCIRHDGQGDDDGDPLNLLINEIFPSFGTYCSDPCSIIDKAILTPKNACMQDINDRLIDKFPGNVREYTSVDLADNPDHQTQYQDFLNAIDFDGLPPHVLRLKKNCPVMLQRNINPSEGLCNGTRMIVQDLGRRVIGATIAAGAYKGKYVFIPRIPLSPSDRLKCPVPFKRHQFPLRLCFAMSINKAQGQTLEKVGIYLPQPVFSHGQLYVALSRVKKADSVKVLIRPPTIDSDEYYETRNVVFREVIQAA